MPSGSHKDVSQIVVARCRDQILLLSRAGRGADCAGAAACCAPNWATPRHSCHYLGKAASNLVFRSAGIVRTDRRIAPHRGGAQGHGDCAPTASAPRAADRRSPAAPAKGALEGCIDICIRSSLQQGALLQQAESGEHLESVACQYTHRNRLLAAARHQAMLLNPTCASAAALAAPRCSRVISWPGVQPALFVDRSFMFLRQARGT